MTDELIAVAPISGGGVIFKDNAVYYLSAKGVEIFRESEAREIPYNVHLGARLDFASRDER